MSRETRGIASLRQMSKHKMGLYRNRFRKNESNQRIVETRCLASLRQMSKHKMGLYRNRFRKNESNQRLGRREASRPYNKMIHKNESNQRIVETRCLASLRQMSKQKMGLYRNRFCKNESNQRLRRREAPHLYNKMIYKKTWLELFYAYQKNTTAPHPEIENKHKV